MAIPIYNPPIPYVGMITGGMFIGRIVRIQGTAHPVANRFSVNLQCGPNVNPRDDIALHMDFRLAQMPPVLVKNSLTMQQWGMEEIHGNLPVVRGQPFDMIIMAEAAFFKVAFNGQHHSQFQHRLPLQRVAYLAIDGDVTISCVIYEGGMGGMPAPMVQVQGIPMATGVPHMTQGVYPAPVHGIHQTGMYRAPMGYPLHSSSYPGAAAVGLTAGAAGTAMMMHGLSPKAMKKHNKKMKKAMKHKHSYGHHGHHKSSSSSSSSSSSEEE